MPAVIALPSGAQADEYDIAAMVARYSPAQRFECADTAVSSLPSDQRQALYSWTVATDLQINAETPKYQWQFVALCIAALHRGVEPLDIAESIATNESAVGILL